MKSKNRAGGILLCVATLIMMLDGVPAMGHDPLKDEHAEQHAGHQHEHHDAAHDLVKPADARALVISFRETGDDRYLDTAWALLEPALGFTSAEPEILVTAAFVAQSRHEFDYAAALITKALAVDKNNNEAWLLLASIQLVRGESESAASACNQLHDVPPLVLITCKARVALATGDHEIVLERLKRVLNLSDSERLPPDVLAWSYSVAGDLAAAAGKSNQAVELFQHSLGLAERTQVRAAVIDVLLSQARFEDAWLTLDGGAPALPLLVRRLIVARHLDRMDEMASVLTKTQIEFEAWIADEDWLHAREMARFFIDVVERPKLARRLALINISLQREPEDQRLEQRTRPPASRQSQMGS